MTSIYKMGLNAEMKIKADCKKETLAFRLCISMPDVSLFLPFTFTACLEK